MGEFNSDDHYIYYCRQVSLKRNGVAIIVNQRVQNAVLGCNLKNDRMISVNFQGMAGPQEQGPLELTGLISLQSKGLSRVSLSPETQKASILWHSAFFMASCSYIVCKLLLSLPRDVFSDDVMFFSA